MGKPVVLAVDGDPAALRSVEVELGRRYLADYEVRCETSAAVALATLAEMRAAGGEVALVLADQWLSGMSGIDFLDRVHALHPGAKRALLISWGDQARAPALAGSALRRIDDWIAKPWAPGTSLSTRRSARRCTSGHSGTVHGSYPLASSVSSGRPGRTRSATC